MNVEVLLEKLIKLNQTYLQLQTHSETTSKISTIKGKFNNIFNEPL